MLCEHIWKFKKLPLSLYWCITRHGKVYTHWKGRKERYNVYCNFMQGKCAVPFIISSSCHINVFSSTTMATFSLDSTKTDANVICFLAVSGSPQNDQYYISTYRSEQVGTCMLLRLLFSAPDKKLCFWKYVQFTVVKKHNCGVFSVSYDSGYCRAVKVQNRQISCWRNIVIKSEIFVYMFAFFILLVFLFFSSGFLVGIC